MFEFLSAYLETAVSPEQKQSYLNACETLVAQGIESHVFAIDQMFALADNLDSDIILDSLTTILVPVYVEALGNFGLVLIESTTLDQYVDVLSAIVLIENYDDPATVHDYCTSGESNEAVMAEILPLMGSLDTGDYLTLIESASDDLIERIQILTSVEPPEKNPPEDIVDRSRDRLLRYLSYGKPAGDQPTLIEEYFENGGRLGFPLGLLIRPYVQRFEEMTVEQKAFESVAFALASDLPDTALKPALKRLYEALHVDIQQITALDIAVDKLLTRLSHA